jgi:hypothetical protein
MVGWAALLERKWLPLLVALVGGVLLHSMNVLMLATVLPSIVEEVGGTSMMSWPTTSFLASSIVAAAVPPSPAKAARASADTSKPVT